MPGRRYANRTDLPANSVTARGDVVSEGRALPVRAAPGQGYGDAKAQTDAQRSVPMGTPAAPQPRPEGVPGPGQMGSIFDPTDRPDEPVTAGSAYGDGPGPEGLRDPATAQRDADVDRLRAYLPALEALVKRPNVSAETRNFVRRLRGLR